MKKQRGTEATKPETVLQRVKEFRAALLGYWKSPLFECIGPDGPEASEWHRVREDDYPAVRKALLNLAHTARNLAEAGANTHDISPLVQLARNLERGLSVICRDVGGCYPSTEDADLLADVIELRAKANAQIDSARAAEQRARVPLDVVADPDCVRLRDILRAGPKMLAAIEKDPRCRSRRRASGLLKAMALRGMVAQTKTRGPWRFVSDTPKK